MMKHSFLSKLLTLCLAVVLLLAVAVPAMAAYTPVGVPTTMTVTLDKYLVMENGILVPPLQFDFDVSTIAADLPATAGFPALKVGPLIKNENGKVTSPSITPVNFVPTDTTHDTVQAGDTVTLETGEMYAKRSATVSFNGLTFDAPGVYRYIVTEEDEYLETNYGATYDTSKTRYMDVYVYDTQDEETPALEVSAVIISNEEKGIPTNQQTAATKDKGFQNGFDCYDFTFSKKVAGNQGNRMEYFEFSIVMDKMNAKAEYTVDLSNATASPVVNGETKTNPTKLVAKADSASGYVPSTSFWLKHGESITIKGITAGAEIFFGEVVDPDLGYTVSRTLTGITSINTSLENHNFPANDASVEYTNTREGTVPTGILLDVAPYALLVAFAGVALILVARKRKTAVR